MIPSLTDSNVTDKALPPLPSLSGQPSEQSGGPGAGSPGFLSSILSGIAPVKSAVDQINAACKAIVQSGTIPGAEQVCAQIVALANSMLPMAAQSLLQPVAGGGALANAGTPSGAPGGLSAPALPPPPGGPAPLMG